MILLRGVGNRDKWDRWLFIGHVDDVEVQLEVEVEIDLDQLYSHYSTG